MTTPEARPLLMTGAHRRLGYASLMYRRKIQYTLLIGWLEVKVGIARPKKLVASLIQLYSQQ
jgi:hypothetical protein